MADEGRVGAVDAQGDQAVEGQAGVAQRREVANDLAAHVMHRERERLLLVDPLVALLAHLRHVFRVRGEGEMAGAVAVVEAPITGDRPRVAYEVEANVRPRSARLLAGQALEGRQRDRHHPLPTLSPPLPPPA